MTLGEYLKSKELKPAQFAAQVPCEPSTITRIIRGERLPSVTLAVRIDDLTDGAVTPKDHIAITEPARAAS